LALHEDALAREPDGPAGAATARTLAVRGRHRAAAAARAALQQACPSVRCGGRGS
jgi:hypothetical protein